MKKDNIYVIMAIGIMIDQLVKFVVRSRMKILESISVIPKFFSISYVENKGAAWGIFQDATFILIIVSFIAFYVLIKLIQEEKNWNRLKIFAFGFVLGGIVGNLIDRLLYHSVTDYLDFYIFGYDFPVFNVADMMIVIGVFLIIAEIVRSEVHEHRSR